LQWIAFSNLAFKRKLLTLAKFTSHLLADLILGLLFNHADTPKISTGCAEAANAGMETSPRAIARFSIAVVVRVGASGDVFPSFIWIFVIVPKEQVTDGVAELHLIQRVSLIMVLLIVVLPLVWSFLAKHNKGP
jgi:hypothetical protein